MKEISIRQRNIIEISEEVLNHLLDYKEKNPSFTFSVRTRDSTSSDQSRLKVGQWFQGSHYIYVPLFKKGDSARRVKTIGFVLNFDKTGDIISSYTEISFKRGINAPDEIKFHKDLAEKIGLKLNTKNHGVKYYSDPKQYIDNLIQFLDTVYPLAIDLLEKYNIKEDYLISEKEFQKSLKRIDKFRKIINSMDRRDKDSKQRKDSKNQILYGPPGTGKTYKTKEIAVEIANSTFKLSSGLDEKERREKIVEEYNHLYEAGQIVFTTFHQSFSYEDFVEGIKPKTTENKQVIYDISPGVFKKLCEKAKDNWLEFSKGGMNHLPFDEALQRLKEDWEENEDLKFPLKTEGKEYKIIGFTESSIQFKKASGGTGHTLSISTLRDAYYGKREIKPTGIGIYYPGILKELQSYGSEKSEAVDIVGEGKTLKNYVLVIDEINRGNVSGIFGELITLLETDKRMGEDEEISVELPYSKEAFTVPPNIYLIGTMNTADRSVEALDTALRRRFSFEEITPKPKLLEDITFDGFNLQEVLKTINQRIEVLIDRDHKIGHSYFIKIESGVTEALKHAFENKVIPLLQEYFYNDYQKIALVLGKGFVEKQEMKCDFANFDGADYPDLDSTFKLKPIGDIELAIKSLLNKSEE